MPIFVEDKPLDTGDSSQDRGGFSFLRKLKQLIIGSGDTSFRASYEGIWLGNADFSSAPFRVNMAGQITCSNLVVSGGSININDVFTVDPDGNAKVNSLERNDFHWFTLFESVDNYGKDVSTGTIVEQNTYIEIKTGATTNNSTELQKIIANPHQSFSWDKDRKFKLLVRLVDDTAVLQYIATGDGQGTTGRKLGFFIQNGTIYGASCDGTTEEFTSGVAFSANDYKLLEIKYISATSAKFYVNGVLLGTLTTYLPSGTTIAGNVLDITLKTTANAIKELQLLYFDFWQGND